MNPAIQTMLAHYSFAANEDKLRALREILQEIELLCRGWKTRIKGRDWYDFAWFVGLRTPVNLRHLEQRMRQSGHWAGNEPLTETAFRELMNRHIDSVNIAQAKEDVSRFLAAPDVVAVWSKDFFMDVAGGVLIE
jgi:hypothetical protein